MSCFNKIGNIDSKQEEALLILRLHFTTTRMVKDKDMLKDVLPNPLNIDEELETCCHI